MNNTNSKTGSEAAREPEWTLDFGKLLRIQELLFLRTEREYDIEQLCEAVARE